MDLYSNYIVEPEYVHERLTTKNFRVIDCTVYFELKKVGASTIYSGHADYLNRHIPGAAYLHMVDDLSDQNNKIPFSIINQETLNRTLSEIGIHKDDEIILYGSGFHMAITRAWWVLKISGLNNIKIMNGGWDAWQERKFPVSSGKETFTKSSFNGHRDDSVILDKEQVKAATKNDDFLLVNALTRKQFSGGGTHYGRPGRIPESINIPALEILDHNTGKFSPKEKMQQQLKLILESKKSIISYCGGGIAATTVYFALKIFGKEDIFLYDNSLLEWSNDQNLPMELD